MTRTTEKIVTFGHCFELASLPGVHPAGSYRVVIDEEEIEGLSFLSYRRSATFLYFPPIEVSTEPREVVPVRGMELDDALAQDKALTGVPAADPA